MVLNDFFFFTVYISWGCRCLKRTAFSILFILEGCGSLISLGKGVVVL